MAIVQVTIVPLGTGTPSVGDYVAADDRRDKKGTMEQKIRSVEEKLK
ncbi:hypothetical protein [Cohnella silvisoli]|uniref:Uncharacterized protein n=1 Tax=Cohnella silvisoli TaxID=2873699 RepID=A0ABV1KY02_9BACL|nr:hypothetical protein [Cohnella silvisoli]MCD9021902.1 hypothetical protein [Cohnella silvisoli]